MANLIQVSLYEAFRTRVFEIPDYQRGYAWEKTQVTDLIEDLSLLPPGRPHFFGTLVLRATGKKLENEKEDDFTVYEIIDGQQRLTTSVIFLSMLYEEMKAHLDYFKMQPDGLKENFLCYTDVNGCPQPKLILNQDCRAFFETNILGFSTNILPDEQSIRSHALMQDVKKWFKEYLDELQKDGEENYLKQIDILYDKIKKSLQLIVYEVDVEIDAAGLMFERMNDRGKPLTELELVKNYILYLSSKLVLESPYDVRTEINETWSIIFHYLNQIENANEADEDQLLRYHWIMTKSGSTKPVNIRNIRDEYNLKKFPVELHKDLHTQLLDYLGTLGRTAGAYRDIRNPDHTDAFRFAGPQWREPIRELSKKLLRMDALATFQPLLIAVRLVQKDDQGESYCKVLELCEKFAFRVYTWKSRPTRTGQSTIYLMARDYFVGRKKLDQVLRQMTNLIFSYSPDKIFEENFDLLNDWYKWGEIKFFLYEYELERVSQRGLPLHTQWTILQKARKEDSIEHILPQNPRPAYWKEKFTDEERELWKNDIGNLTLTYYNGELSDLSFPEKRDGRPDRPDCYRRSLIVIEQEIADNTEWTVNQIQTRREVIRNWVLRRWHVDKPALPQPSTTSKKEAEKTFGQSDPTINKKAAWLSREQRDPETWLVSLAEEKGWKDGFCQLIEAFRDVGLFPRMQNNWWVVAVTPLNQKNRAVLWFGPDFYFEPSPDQINQLLRIPPEITQKLLGEKRSIKPEDVPGLVTAIHILFASPK